MASLYEISNDILRIFNEVEINDGEITEEQCSLLDIRENELKDKLDAYVKVVKEFESAAEFCKKEKKSINDRQNLYKNRIDRLKNAMLTAVQQFGEQGSTNKFVELPTCRIFTRSSKSIVVDDFRTRVLIDVYRKYIEELVQNGVLYTGDDVDMEGVLGTLNAFAKANYGDDFEPFTMGDLFTTMLDTTVSCSIHGAFKLHRDLLMEIGNNPMHCSIKENTPKENYKNMLEATALGQEFIPTVASIVNNESIQIK